MLGPVSRGSQDPTLSPCSGILTHVLRLTTSSYTLPNLATHIVACVRDPVQHIPGQPPCSTSHYVRAPTQPVDALARLVRSSNPHVTPRSGHGNTSRQYPSRHSAVVTSVSLGHAPTGPIISQLIGWSNTCQSGFWLYFSRYVWLMALFVAPQQC